MRRGHVGLLIGPQNGLRVDAVVWGEESGRGGVEEDEGGEGGVGGIEDRPAGRDVEDSDGGGGVRSQGVLAVSSFRR